MTGLADIVSRYPYVMFGGKGGLGKTTFSAATAYWLAAQGKKVLVFSVDPQASLSDIFQRDIFGKGPVQIKENLWAQEIDADTHIKAYQNEVRQKILDMYGFDKVVKGDYDCYIYDLVPLGHALYYLSMAKVYDEWINRITKLREQMREYEEMVSQLKQEKKTEEDAILTELTYIKSRINASSRILTDRDKTAFFFVVIPEEMIILDTRKAATLFAAFNVPIAGYVVNRVVPRELLGQDIPPYLRNRIEMQAKYMDQINTDLGAQVRAFVPEMERDVTGLPMIEKLAGIMYGNGR